MRTMGWCACRRASLDSGFVADPLNIASLLPLSPEVRERISMIDSSITLTDIAGWFDGEIRADWGDYTADAYLRPGSQGQRTRAERDAVLAEADVILGAFPIPLDLRGRTPRLRWFHQTPAGASNLRRSDLWGSDVIVTTSRGLGNTLAIAEYVVAAFLHFGRDLHQAFADPADSRLRRSEYRPVLLAGKTVCVVGAGGIGAEVGRLCHGLGMRVVGTRRSVGGELPPGFAHVGGPDDLHDRLAEADFVAICCQWTSETHGLIGSEAFAAMPDGAVVVNVARGEVIDEVALVEAVDRLRGVALDVYVGEFEHPPPAALWDHPRVLITPHVSGGSDDRSGRPIELFCRNLEALLQGRELENVVDWDRGY